MKRRSSLVLASLLLWCWSATVAAFAPFTIEDIRIEGLQRISPGTVFTYLPLKVGDRVDELAMEKAIRSLYKAGFFDDIEALRDGDVLVIRVRERPAIASIEISGNRDIETDDLIESLKSIGLQEGHTFNRSLLDRVEQELRQQYFANGKYGVRIETSVEPLERNRVAIAIKIAEGKAAKIREINIVGNKVFADDLLRAQIQLTTPTLFSIFTSNDQYSRQKLAADLETLRSYYLDRGYLNFRVESTQVAISPDRRYIYITINIHEGEQYRVSDVRVSGKTVVPTEELERLISIHAGDVYSQKLVSASSTRMINRLGNEGFAFANVNPVPEPDAQKREVRLVFFVDPGRRVYVRRVNIGGNRTTKDEVIRREMRQMEGGWLSTARVERSRTRLNRLGYFSEVNVETPPVPGSSDQVDVNYRVTEQPSGNFMASVGYAQSDGALFSINLQEKNFLGTGNQVGVTVNTSSISTVYAFDYVDPYWTDDGISRGYSLRYQRTDAERANLSNYSLDIGQARILFGIPISEFNRLHLSAGLKRTTLHVTCSSPDEAIDYLLEHGGTYSCEEVYETVVDPETGEETQQFVGLALNTDPADIDTVELGLGWSHDTRNRFLFANRGAYHSISAEVAAPGGDVQYYKIRYRYQQFFPLTKSLTWVTRAELGYGDGYGTTDALPFYENFYAGGPRTVRGYRLNTLGPRDSNGNPLGGGFLTVGGLDLLFPLPFAQDTSKTFQLGAFFDTGSVFPGIGDFDRRALRSSVGIAALWSSPIGPISVSLAQPINEGPEDDIESFQFTLGGSF